MYKSNPIPMIRENTQMNVVKLSVCYQYKTDGHHAEGELTPTHKALTIDFYGIDKNGEHLIAKCPLETGDYVGKSYASSIIECIPSIEYPFVCFTYDKSLAPDLIRINSIGNVFVEASEVSDIQSDKISSDAIVTA